MKIGDWQVNKDKFQFIKQLDKLEYVEQINENFTFYEHNVLVQLKLTQFI